MDARETRKIYMSISDHVISKTGSELVSNGKLKLSLLNEIHATWKSKMIQAGVISGKIETASSPVTVHALLQTHDPNPLPLYAGIDIDALFPFTEIEMVIKKGFHIPQKDGSGDGDDADIKPNVSNAPYDEDDEELNENDDDGEEGGGINANDIPNLIVCQFDYVKKKKNKTTKTTKDWECKFKAGVMHINGEQILFSEVRVKKTVKTKRYIIKDKTNLFFFLGCSKSFLLVTNIIKSILLFSINVNNFTLHMSYVRISNHCKRHIQDPGLAAQVKQLCFPHEKFHVSLYQAPTRKDCAKQFVLLQ
ncbi:hypothetical protein N665_1363s0011 [Sinapis alba]|nr:hypothetical protein N665_1363s0011 [Sinapis alba]